MKISFLDDEPEIFPTQYGGKARTIMTLAGRFVKRKDVEQVNILSRSINDARKKIIWNEINLFKLDSYDMVKRIVDEASDVDILNVHASSFTFPRLRTKKAKIINHMHDVIFATCDAGSHLDKAIGGYWDAIVTPSPFASRTLKNVAPWKSSETPIYTIQRAIDGETFKKIEKREAYKKITRLNGSLKNVSARYPVIFFPHRVNAGKGEILLPKIYKKLKEEYPNCLVITTFKTQEGPGFEDFINVGWIKTIDMKYFYSISDLTVSLSFLPESFSQVCLESVSCGTPVVCLRFGNLSTLSLEFPAIQSCKPEIEDISSNIIKLLKDSKKTALNITASKKILKEKYSPTTVVKEYIRVYEELLSNTVKLDEYVLNDEFQFFTSPLIADHGQTVYLYENGQLNKYIVSDTESCILHICLESKTLKELQNTLKIEQEKIKKSLKKLIDERLIIRS